MTAEHKREIKRAWRVANRDKVLAEKKRYREKYRAKIRLADKAFYQANKPKRMAVAKKWKLANPDKVRAAGRKHSRKSYSLRKKELIASVIRSRIKRLANETEEERHARILMERENRNRWIANNPEKHKEMCRKSREKNHANRIVASRTYSANNKEKLAEKQRRYRKEKPYVYKQQKHRRRARKLGATVQDCKDRISRLQTEKFCNWCDCQLTKENLSIDHIMPLSKGGQHKPYNLVACCRSCNSKKNDKLPLEWMAILKEAA